MVTLTTEHGEFSAETEAEAVKLARKAKREAAKEEKRQEAARTTALQRAKTAGFRVYDRFLEDKPMPPAWIIHKAGNRFFPAQRYEAPYTYTRIDTEDGRGEIRLYDRGYSIVASVDNGAGFTMLLFVKDCDTTDPPRAYAVGVCDGVANWVRLEKPITLELFREWKPQA